MIEVSTIKSHCMLGFTDGIYYRGEHKYWLPRSLIEQTETENMKSLDEWTMAKYGICVGAFELNRPDSYENLPYAVGFAALTDLIETETTLEGVLGSLIVDKDYRCQGLGFSLVGCLVEAIKEKSASGVVTPLNGLSAKCNKASLSIFTKLGFEPVGEGDGKTVVQMDL